MTPSRMGRLTLMCRGRAPEHLARMRADSHHAVVGLFVSHERGLVEHDAAALHVDEDVGCAEVDADVLGEHSVGRREV